MPDFVLEDQQNGWVIGVDEVGRGPLAGPVVAAAVYIPPDRRLHPVWRDVQDSKKLSSVRREVLFDVIKGQCLFGLGEASVAEIDQINILQATFLAMRRAIEMVVDTHGIPAPFLLIDGNRRPKDWFWECQTVVKGDAKSVSIAAASILAKVTRDRLMADLAQDFPAYGWAQNAGYGTPEHLSALSTHGITPHHRLSFAPVKRLQFASSC